MKYRFFGQPNMLVKTRKKIPFENRIDFKPLFRFDSNGEYETDDEKLIEKLKSRFDHLALIESQENGLEIVLPTEEKITSLNAFKCKKCFSEFENKGELLAHYKKEHREG